MADTNAAPPALSKNKLKKLKRDQEWEANRDVRKAIRKEKAKERKERKRKIRDEAAAKNSPGQIAGPASANQPSSERKHLAVKLPVSFVIDCGFDDLMVDQERKSLSSQITRCYSENNKALFQAHLAISSFDGPLKDRFNGVLLGNYKSWKGVKFLAKDFVETSEEAQEWIQAKHGSSLKGAFTTGGDAGQATDQAGEVVYLSSDSSETLTELRPYSTYIIGGLVDRNRHKGICYKRAMEKGIRTARLPIGEYMQMNSRSVLTTNHVVEIMLRWLEFRDWGKAFMEVMPKRKGGGLKSEAQTEENGQNHSTTVESGDGEEPDVEVDDPEPMGAMGLSGRGEAGTPVDESTKILPKQDGLVKQENSTEQEGVAKPEHSILQEDEASKDI